MSNGEAAKGAFASTRSTAILNASPPLMKDQTEAEAAVWTIGQAHLRNVRPREIGLHAPYDPPTHKYVQRHRIGWPIRIPGPPLYGQATQTFDGADDTLPSADSERLLASQKRQQFGAREMKAGFDVSISTPSFEIMAACCNRSPRLRLSSARIRGPTPFLGVNRAASA